MILASLLLTIAIWLNKDDMKMLLLTLLVGLSYFLPTELITNYYAWYFVVMTSEMVVMCSAICLKTRASLAITTICVMLLINHVNGLFFGGHLEGSPYHFVIKYLEYIELLACSLFSTTIVNKLGKVYRNAIS